MKIPRTRKKFRALLESGTTRNVVVYDAVRLEAGWFTRRLVKAMAVCSYTMKLNLNVILVSNTVPLDGVRWGEVVDGIFICPHEMMDKANLEVMFAEELKATFPGGSREKENIAIALNNNGDAVLAAY